MDRSRIAVMFFWEEKRQSIILSSGKKNSGAGRRVKNHQKFPRWIYQGQAAGVCPSVPAFPNRRQSIPFQTPHGCVLCVTSEGQSSSHRWSDTSFCAFLGMLEQIVLFRVISFHPKLQTTALWGYSNSGLSRGNLVELVNWWLCDWQKWILSDHIWCYQAWILLSNAVLFQ